jgi:hypothetical protein
MPEEEEAIMDYGMSFYLFLKAINPILAEKFAGALSMGADTRNVYVVMKPRPEFFSKN